MTGKIIQPYQLARAKYNYTTHEMIFLMFIINKFQPYYQQQINGGTVLPVQKDLFGKMEFRGIPLSEVGSVKNNDHKKYKDALMSLATKNMRVITKDYETIAHLVEYPKYYHGKGIVDFDINPDLVPFFISLAHGYTYIDLITLFKLPPYQQRMYMLMCQHEDTGIVKIHAQELRAMFGLEDKYNHFPTFKKRIIEPAQKALTQLFDKLESKLTFHYEKNESKKTQDDTWDRVLTFKVVSIYNSERKNVKQFDNESYQFIQRIIAIVYTNNSNLHRAYLNHISKLNDDSKFRLYLRLNTLYRVSVDQGKLLLNNEDLQKIISTIMRKDFNYQNQTDTWETKN